VSARISRLEAFLGSALPYASVVTGIMSGAVIAGVVGGEIVIGTEQVALGVAVVTGLGALYIWSAPKSPSVSFQGVWSTS
jgi:hypothetical protein